MVDRVCKAFEDIGFKPDPTLLGQSGYPDIAFSSGERRVTVDCWEGRRGEVTPQSMTLAGVHRKNYRSLLGTDVDACVLVAGFFTQDAIDETYNADTCGLLCSLSLDRALAFSRRFMLTSDEMFEVLGSRGLLDIPLDNLIEKKRDEQVGMAAITNVLRSHGEPMPIWDVGTELAENYNLLMASDRLSYLLSMLKSPPLSCILEQSGKWVFLRSLPGGFDR